MILSEFLKGRNVKINAVSNYISRNPELFAGHVEHKGKNTFLDDAAIRELEKKYPLAKPVEIINGVPEEEYRQALNELAKIQKKFIRLQEDFLQVKTDLLETKAENMEIKLLETSKNAEISNLRENNSLLHQELEKMRNRTLWERIRNR